MREPAVRCGAVPVLHAGGDVDTVARSHLHGVFAPLLVIAPAGHTDEDLSAAFVGVVDVPIIAASRLKGYIKYPDLAGGYGREVALA